MSVDFTSKERKRAIQAELARVRFDTPYGKEVKRFLAHGVGLHHAGLLPKYRLLVEKLAQKGLLAIVSGTDTLGVGVNVPIRTVLFTRLCKYDGEKTAILTVREFQQIAGRAGRRGFDDEGFVAVQAPEHVIENLRLEQKAGDDPVKRKRIVRRKPPEKGYVHWDRSTFDRLVTGQPEPLVSRFRVSHGMVLSVLDRPDGGARGCRELARLIFRSHERRAQKRIFGREAVAMVESLKEAGIVEAESMRVHMELQEDFSIHHALSLWLVDTLPMLDRESPSYAVDVLTLVESILENPDYVLRQQLDALKTAKLAELKMAGVEYEERMAELEKLEHPKPLRELVYGSFNDFARVHPWVQGDDVRPKSIAREMNERFMDFNEYVREYELGRAEGTLLRYLSDVYKAVVQTVPAPAKTPEVEEVEVFLRAVVRAVDSSLLDEWERLRAPEALIERGAGEGGEQAAGEVDVTQDERGFTVLVRNAMFQVLRAVAKRDWAAAAALLEQCPPEELERAFGPFYADHSAVRLDPTARSPQATRITKTTAGVWEVVQVVCDADGHDDWAMSCAIDLEASARLARPVITFHGAGAG
jgi:hypothetical protein